ncbi:MAG: protein translocase subunit SecF [Ruminococcus sp.]|nr:protein translocase subunit SecF [Ruminococcus sp.]
MTKKSKKEIAALMPAKVYNFCGKKKMILGIAIAVIVAFIVGLIVRGVNLSIDFKGGSEISYSYTGDISANDVADAVDDLIESKVNVKLGSSIGDDDKKQIIIAYTSSETFDVSTDYSYNFSYTGEITADDINKAGELIKGVDANIELSEPAEGTNILTVNFTKENFSTDEAEALTATLTEKFTGKEIKFVDSVNKVHPNALTERLMEKFPENNIDEPNINNVSSSTAREALLKCLVAVLFAAVVIIIYIAIRFRKIGGWSAGLCSIFALCHDLVVAIAVTIIFGFEFDKNTVAVLLTILGYSINNTIVIYDRIRENRTIFPKASLSERINISCTQSLTRSIRTSITTISTMLIISVVVFVTGYHSLLSFSVPLMFGLISGTYSSIFVAPVTWSWMKNRKKAKKSAEKKK